MVLFINVLKLLKSISSIFNISYNFLGGYVAGKASLVQAALVHLSAPGVDGGATFQKYRTLFQGLFMAPGVVGESVKGAELVAEVMQNQLGYPTNPAPSLHRTDIIQAVQLGSRDKVNILKDQF